LPAPSGSTPLFPPPTASPSTSSTAGPAIGWSGNSSTARPAVERDEQVKGYPLENGDYIVIEDDACLKPVARQFLFGY
jgi:hypothetical protein